eukprot:m.259317 g.259317  ORF g.259317 m.259317 type:complete len:721 (-) comp37890_c0_seq1:266-2428(-)
MATTTSRFAIAFALMAGATALTVKTYRPDPSTWKRTPCGHPSSSQPAGPYNIGVDMPGNDMAPCGSPGCVLAVSATHLDCERKCNTTTNCVAYVFAPANCSGNGNICWLKSGTVKGDPRSCRNSRVLANSSPGADIPSKWASQVSASTTPLVAYPRPQMARGSMESVDKLRDVGDSTTWVNLNGLWEYEANPASTTPDFGKALPGSILVPFPVESCLSGNAPNSSANIVMNMRYRLTFDADATDKTLLHFGAIDWQATVYFNGQELGNHTGGYDGFSFDVTQFVKPTGNELIVSAYDPSDTGSQPNGKQRISAISSPGGDTYTPSSGIWQTVWLETVPVEYINDITINQASTSEVVVTVDVVGSETSVKFVVTDKTGKVVATATGVAAEAVTIAVPNAELWSPSSPYLYDLQITVGQDSVMAYFGLRVISLKNGTKGLRTQLNGEFTFFAGFLDQSWWPDGQYTAPTDDALAYDVEAVPMFGLNMIRLHQKVNPERWYYHADRLGVAVFQDMVQKYGGATSKLIPYFVADLKAMVKGRGNHPCIVQFETFNEGDCWSVFKDKPYDVAGIVALARELAPNRLIDTDSGGGANNLHIGDVDDIHSYPYPGDPQPSATQYAMIGEFGGIGAFVTGKEWKPNACHTYLHVDTPADEASTYIKMAATIQSRVDHVSASVYTQTTDLELECDGFLNYDRSNKFSDADTAAIKTANQAIIKAAAAAV